MKNPRVANMRLTKLEGFRFLQGLNGGDSNTKKVYGEVEIIFICSGWIAA